MGLGPYAGFILASYASAAVVISGMIAWLWVDGRRLARALSNLEARGIKRRSD